MGATTMNVIMVYALLLASTVSFGLISDELEDADRVIHDTEVAAYEEQVAACDDSHECVSELDTPRYTIGFLPYLLGVIAILSAIGFILLTVFVIGFGLAAMNEEFN